VLCWRAGAVSGLFATKLLPTVLQSILGTNGLTRMPTSYLHQEPFSLIFPMLFPMLQRQLSSAYKAESNTAELLSF
jgi:hypothetical protein